jgi:hypothetical protein
MGVPTPASAPSSPLPLAGGAGGGLPAKTNGTRADSASPPLNPLPQAGGEAEQEAPSRRWDEKQNRKKAARVAPAALS